MARVGTRVNGGGQVIVYFQILDENEKDLDRVFKRSKITVIAKTRQGEELTYKISGKKSELKKFVEAYGYELDECLEAP